MRAGWFAVPEAVELLLSNRWHEFCSNTLSTLDAGAGGTFRKAHKADFRNERSGQNFDFQYITYVKPRADTNREVSAQGWGTPHKLPEG
jgi:hypothetical protein